MGLENDETLSAAEFDDLFDLSVTTVGDSVETFALIGDSSVGSYTMCAPKDC